MAGTNFFERQDKAHRATRLLVVWFGLAVLGTALAIYAVVMIALNYADVVPSGVYWDPKIFTCAFGGTLLLVGGASFFKSLELGASSGETIARELGGVAVNPNSGDPLKQRLVNVVQEMSIASCVPMPKIFILERESGINAFAAGTRVDNAAIAVSRGALDKLSRDELQAVVGHEFSHILNGDMRLNVKLIGWIFGLIVLALVGRVLMQSAALSGNSRSRKNDGAQALVFIGLAILIIGSISQFFAGIIQAAISRHRERLADASATQFTRNPIALANALSRIGGDSSILNSPHAGEYSHFFFASGINSLFATHPPLEERIRALNPSWDGKFLRTSSPEPAVGERAKPAEMRWPLADLAKTAKGARALVFLLMMTHSRDDDNAQANLLLKTEKKDVFALLEANWEAVAALPPEKRLSLVMLAAPQLREFSQKERQTICRTLRQLAEADGEIALFEFLIIRIVEGLLLWEEEKNVSESELRLAAASVFSVVMRENAFSPAVAAGKLQEILAAQSFFLTQMALVPDSKLGVSDLDNAFDVLRSASIIFRENLIKVCDAVALADGKLTPSESDFINAVALALGCPIYKRVKL